MDDSLNERTLIIIPPLSTTKEKDILASSSTCIVCYQEKPSGCENFVLKLRTCTCSSTCVSCFITYLRTEIFDGRVNLACPQCPERLHPLDIQGILAQQTTTENDDVSANKFLLQKYEEFMIRRVLIRDPDCRWCPGVDCTYAVIASNCAACPRLECEREACRTDFCYNCKQLWHPDQPCAFLQQPGQQQGSLIFLRKSSTTILEDGTTANNSGNVAASSSWMPHFALRHAAPASHLGLIKSCPVCKAMIAKADDGSCNHMTCVMCGTDFCWLCLRPVSDLHFLSPSGCTFWGKRPWSQKKKLICQISTLIGAPVGIVLMAGLAVPAIMIGVPAFVGRTIYGRLKLAKRWKRNTAVTLGVIGAAIGAPVVAAFAIGVGVPCMAAYVYGVVPVALARTALRGRGRGGGGGGGAGASNAGNNDVEAAAVAAAATSAATVAAVSGDEVDGGDAERITPKTGYCTESADYAAELYNNNKAVQTVSEKTVRSSINIMQQSCCSIKTTPNEVFADASDILKHCDTDNIVIVESSSSSFKPTMTPAASSSSSSATKKKFFSGLLGGNGAASTIASSFSYRNYHQSSNDNKKVRSATISTPSSSSKPQQVQSSSNKPHPHQHHHQCCQRSSSVIMSDAAGGAGTCSINTTTSKIPVLRAVTQQSSSILSDAVSDDTCCPRHHQHHQHHAATAAAAAITSSSRFNTRRLTFQFGTSRSQSNATTGSNSNTGCGGSGGGNGSCTTSMQGVTSITSTKVCSSCLNEMNLTNNGVLENPLGKKLSCSSPGSSMSALLLPPSSTNESNNNPMPISGGGTRSGSSSTVPDNASLKALAGSIACAKCGVFGPATTTTTTDGQSYASGAGKLSLLSGSRRNTGGRFYTTGTASGGGGDDMDDCCSPHRAVAPIYNKVDAVSLSVSKHVHGSSNNTNTTSSYRIRKARAGDSVSVTALSRDDGMSIGDEAGGGVVTDEILSIDGESSKPASTTNAMLPSSEHGSVSFNHA